MEGQADKHVTGFYYGAKSHLDFNSGKTSVF